MPDLIDPNTYDSAKTLTNLQILRNHIATLPVDYEHFDMQEFGGQPREVTYDALSECGTAACLLGHAALILGAPERYGFWSGYSDSVFPALRSPNRSVADHIWTFLFSGDWAYHDNTLAGAVKRLDYVLEHRAYPPAFSSAEGYNFAVSF